MGAIQIPDAILDAFAELGREVITSLKAFHHKVGWDEYCLC